MCVCVHACACVCARVCVCVRVVGSGEGSWVIASTAVSSSGIDDRTAVLI